MWAAVAWSAYLVIAFGVTPALFRRAHGRWPFVTSVPPCDRYALVEQVYACALMAYTIWLWLDPPATPGRWWLIAGALCWSCGVALIAWSVRTLGPHWRIGQDERDAGVAYVRRGPYAIVSHPIYVGLVLVVLCQGALSGFAGAWWVLMGSTLVYIPVQSAAESARWSAGRIG